MPIRMATPLIDHLDLMVEFLTVLVTVPVPRLPFALHLVDCLAGQVVFLSCSVKAKDLSLIGKKGLVTTTVFCAFLEDKMTPSIGIPEGNMGTIFSSP